MPKLAIHRAGALERELNLDGRDLRIGRAAQNDVVLEDATKGVSRLHAELTFENGQYVLRDLNSENGLWVANRRVPKIVMVPNEPVAIGRYTVTLIDAPTPASPFAETVIAASEPDGPASPVGAATSGTFPVASGATSQSASTERGARTATPTQAVRPAGLPKWMLTAGLSTAAVLLLIVGLFIFIPRNHKPPEVLVLPPVQGTAPTPQTPDNNTAAAHLSAARSALQENDLQKAMDEVDKALGVEPDNAEALALKDEILQKSEGPHPVETKDRGPKPGSPVTPLDAWAVKYEEAKTIEERGTANDALKALCDIDITYKDVKTRVDRLADRARAAAKDALADGDRLEKQGDLLGTQAEYDKVGPLMRGLSQTCPRVYQPSDTTTLINVADESLRRVRARMKTEGDEAFRKAKGPFAIGLFDEARPLYEIAVKYLPDSDPNKREARENLERIRRGR